MADRPTAIRVQFMDGTETEWLPPEQVFTTDVGVTLGVAPETILHPWHAIHSVWSTALNPPDWA